MAAIFNRKALSKRQFSGFVSTLSLLALSIQFAHASGKSEMNSDEKISKFGEYSGYSTEQYDSWQVSSQYITLEDGTRLAADIIRPAVNGKVVEKPMPVILSMWRYHRNSTGYRRFLAESEGQPVDDTKYSLLDDDPVLEHLVKNGYTVASVSVRGSGASFGRDVGIFSRKETADTNEVINWLAKQPWSTGNVGMYGLSYMGITQYMAASLHNPALKAIVPDVALYDLYDIFYDGGIYKNDYVNQWGEAVQALDTIIPSIPVDSDTDGQLLKQAMVEHEANWTPQTPFTNGPFRDIEQHEWNWKNYGPIDVIDKINQSGVPIYHYSGWYDAFVAQTPRIFNNYPGPDALLIGPWGHDKWNEAIDQERIDVNSVQHLRWYDRWLKGIENGIEKDDKVNYAVIDVPGEKWHWESSPAWPIAGIQEQVLYLSGDKANSVESLNDGSLAFNPIPSVGNNGFKVDITTTTGTASRWDNCTGVGPLLYPDMTANDKKSLTYTTSALSEDMTVVGYPMIKLQASSDKPDGDFHVLLEEVEADGTTHLVTEGQLRLSMRKKDAEQKASWHDGLWRRQNQQDVLPVEPGQWYDVEIELMPTAYLFNQGNRIRITVMGADKDNAVLPKYQDAKLAVQFGGEQGSQLVLPVKQS
ncbi:CocE/NonD family hydrolase [Vibrio sp.]|uniref:CocE/NonD family hydrolase n=1 Tax=Vibrio sp. TaxID=678 RepID=UPI003D0CB25B